MYSPEMAARLCARLAGGMSLRAICRGRDMPSRNTVLRWVGENETFRDQYVRAMEARALAQGEEVDEIANMVLRGDLDPRAGAVAMEGKKWSASRMAPKVWGDRVMIDKTVRRVEHLRIEIAERLALLVDGRAEERVSELPDRR